MGVNESYFAVVNIVTRRRGREFVNRASYLRTHGENVLLRQSEERAINIPPSKIYTRHMWTIRKRRLIDRLLTSSLYFSDFSVDI